VVEDVIKLTVGWKQLITVTVFARFS
jgi:hypothetical protein